MRPAGRGIFGLVFMLAIGAGRALGPALAEERPPEVTDRVMQIVRERCALCHGEEGEASSSIYPRLAHQNRRYLEKQLKNFRDGTRKSDVMNEQARDLTDEEIAGLAAWFASRPPKAHRIPRSKQDLAAVGRYIFHKGNKWSDIPPCASCHGEMGEGNERLPRLAGQHKRYVIAQLKNFHERRRTNDNAIMHTIARNLTELEIQAVALYVSGLAPEQKKTE